MLRECVAIGREPRNEKTEGFRVCPASKKEVGDTRRKECVRLRRRKSETPEEKSVSGFEEGSRRHQKKRECPASKKKSETQRKKERECPASRKGNYESQLVESFKNNQSSQMACYEELFPARHVQAGIIA